MKKQQFKITKQTKFQIYFRKLSIFFSLKFEKIEKELKNAQFLVEKLQEEKMSLEKNFKKMQINEEKLIQDLNKVKESYFLLEEQKKNEEFHHNSVILFNLQNLICEINKSLYCKEFELLENKLDNFVAEMNQVKNENEKLLEDQISAHKKIVRLESENEELKNENVKIKIKLESLQKGTSKFEVFNCLIIFK